MKSQKIMEAAEIFGVHPHVLLSNREYEADELQMYIDLEKIIRERGTSEHFAAVKSLLALAAAENENPNS